MEPIEDDYMEPAREFSLWEAFKGLAFALAFFSLLLLAGIEVPM